MKGLPAYFLIIATVLAVCGGATWAAGKRGGGGHHAGGRKAVRHAMRHIQKPKAVLRQHPHRRALHVAQHRKEMAHHPRVKPRIAREVHMHPKGINQGGPVRGLHSPHNTVKPTKPARLASVAKNVRTQFTARHRHVFTPRWWQNRSITNVTNVRWFSHWWAHPGPYYWWRRCSWVALTGWLPGVVWSAPTIYDYGSNIYYQDDGVYINSIWQYSADQYLSAGPDHRFECTARRLGEIGMDATGSLRRAASECGLSPRDAATRDK